MKGASIFGVVGHVAVHFGAKSLLRVSMMLRRHWHLLELFRAEDSVIC
jgi:hypothetical protein